MWIIALVVCAIVLLTSDPVRSRVGYPTHVEQEQAREKEIARNPYKRFAVASLKTSILLSVSLLVVVVVAGILLVIWMESNEMEGVKTFLGFLEQFANAAGSLLRY
jgi:ABC-type Fe3+ transport system permease subunit